MTEKKASSEEVQIIFDKIVITAGANDGPGQIEAWKELENALGSYQAEMARILNVVPSVISKIQRGKSFPQYEHLSRFATCLSKELNSEITLKQKPPRGFNNKSPTVIDLMIGIAKDMAPNDVLDIELTDNVEPKFTSRLTKGRTTKEIISLMELAQNSAIGISISAKDGQGIITIRTKLADPAQPK